jgi:hypothetical protein
MPNRTKCILLVSLIGDKAQSRRMSGVGLCSCERHIGLGAVHLDAIGLGFRKAQRTTNPRKLTAKTKVFLLVLETDLAFLGRCGLHGGGHAPVAAGLQLG